MKKKGLFYLVVVLACALLGAHVANAADASDVFFEAYQTFQTAEKLEGNGDIDGAVTRLKKAEQLLLQVAKSSPDWQPLVVQYRLGKTRENLARLETSLAQSPSNAAEDVSAGEQIEGELPLDFFQKSPDVLAPPAVMTSPQQAPRPRRPAAPGRQYSNPPTYSEPPPAYRDVPSANSSADRQIRLLKQRLNTAERENEQLNRRLEQAEANLMSAKMEVEKTKVSVVELKSQLAESRQALESADKGGDQYAALQAEYKVLEEKLAAAEADKEVLQEDYNRVSEKLEKAGSYIAESEKIRTRLLEDRDDLSKALAGKGVEINPVEHKRLKEENASLQTRLASTTEQVKALTGQLDVANAELARMKLNPAPTEDEKKAIAENELLKGIIVRQLGEQARRDDARQVIESELANLNIRSDVLDQQLEVLSTPVMDLSDEERQLFKDPVALLKSSDPSSMKATIAMALPSRRSNKRLAAPAPEPGNPEAKLQPEIDKARELYDAQKFAEAETVYLDIVRVAPTSHLVQANLGIVQLQLGKLSDARAALEKAVELDPNDPQALTYLGIVCDREGKVERAVELLGKSLEIDGANYIAHNYYGVCLGKKGNTTGAEKEIKRAIELKPDYAAAHFNLAILYATGKPPSLKLAKQYYAKAIELGAAPDTSLEKLISKS